MKFDNSIVQTRYDSPLGPMIVAATTKGLAGLWFEGQKHMPDNADWPEQSGHPVLRRAVAQLDEYFSGKRTCFNLPLDLQGGTPFQQSVWLALQQIPCGDTTSYGQLSQRIGKPAAVRAVGAAVGRNPVSVVLPCHRVLGAGGALTGYAGGVERKSALLQLEGARSALRRRAAKGGVGVRTVSQTAEVTNKARLVRRQIAQPPPGFISVERQRFRASGQHFDLYLRSGSEFAVFAGEHADDGVTFDQAVHHFVDARRSRAKIPPRVRRVDEAHHRADDLRARIAQGGDTVFDVCNHARIVVCRGLRTIGAGAESASE